MSIYDRLYGKDRIGTGLTERTGARDRLSASNLAKKRFGFKLFGSPAAVSLRAAAAAVAAFLSLSLLAALPLDVYGRQAAEAGRGSAAAPGRASRLLQTEEEDMPAQELPDPGQEGSAPVREVVIGLETLPKELWEICQQEAEAALEQSSEAQQDLPQDQAEPAPGTILDHLVGIPGEQAGTEDLTGPAGSAGSPDPAGFREIRIHLAGAPGAPVPAEVMDADTASLLKQISEGLTVLDENGEAAPGAARSWEVSEDGLTWTFTLREGLCWSDGAPMEAADFVELFNRTADPSAEVLYGQHLMRNIAGYEALLNGEADALEVYADGAGTLTVHLTAPDPGFARACASWALLPIRELIRDVPERETEETDDRADRAETDLFAQRPDWDTVTGNGPYVIASCIPGQEYRLEKNPYYHPDAAEGTARGEGSARDRVPFDAVRWMVDGDANEEYSDFLNGEMDAMAQIPPEEEAMFQAAAAEGTQVKNAALPYAETPVPDVLGILFNCRKEALKDPRVRRALSLAADRAFITSEILDNVYLPASQWAIEDNWETAFSALEEADGTDLEAAALEEAGSAGTQASAFIEIGREDAAPAAAEAKKLLAEAAPAAAEGKKLLADTASSAAEAKKLLAEAGYPGGKGFPRLTCLALEDDASFLIAEYLASAWRELGIDVQAAAEEAGDLAQEKAAGTFEIVCGSISLASDLPSAELAGFASDSAENLSGFSSEGYDREMERAAEARGHAAYEEALSRAREILTGELPAAPLAVRRRSWLWQDACGGIFCDASGCWQVWKASPQIPGDAGAAAGTENGAGSGEADPERDPQEGEADPEGEPQEGEQGSGRDARAYETASDTDGAGAAPGQMAERIREIEVAAYGGIPGEAKEEDEGSLSARLDGLTRIFTPAGRREEGDEEEEEGDGSGEQDNFLFRLRSALNFFEKADTDAWLTRQAWILESAQEGAARMVSLPKYTKVHLTGTGNARFARIDVDGKFRYLDADRVTPDRSAVEEVREGEEEQALQREMLAASLHEVKERELMDRAADVRAETERILAEIAHHEMIKTQTRNPDWDGPVLSRSKGSVTGPSGKETYYNLNMSGVVNIMRRMGNTDEYWVRDDGCKMLGDYIMCAANLGVHPRGSLVECSLGTCIVCDTGGFASRNAHQLDIAVTW